MNLSKPINLLIGLLNTCEDEGTINANEFLTEANLDGFAEDLMNDCIEGYRRHSRSLNRVIDLIHQFYRYDKLLVEKSNLFKVLLYFLLFETEKIGLDRFELILDEYLSWQLYQFLQFVTNEDNVTGVLRRTWLQFYEERFVDANLVQPLIRVVPDLQGITEKIFLALKAKSKKKPIARPLTVPQPFNFIQPRTPGELYERSKKFALKTAPLPQVQKAKARQDEAAKPEDKKRAVRNVEENRKAYNFRKSRYLQPQKTEATLKKMAEIQEEKEQALQFDKPKVCDLPPLTHVTVKQNTAAILREGVLIEKKLRKRLKELQELEQGTFTEVDCMQQGAELQAKQLFLTVEERRLAGMLTREAALLARQVTIKKNKEKVQQMKLEMEETIAESMQEKRQEEKRIKRIVQQVSETQTRAKVAMQKLMQQKSDIGEMAIVIETGSAGFEDRSRQSSSREEKRRQQVLVHEIRALESSSVARRSLDRGDTCSPGLLKKMSAAELHERLSLLKTWQKEEEAEKRAQIQAQKKERERHLESIHKFITQFKQKQSLQKRSTEQPKQLVMSRDTHELKQLRVKLAETQAQRKLLQERQPSKRESKRLKEFQNMKTHILNLL